MLQCPLFLPPLGMAAPHLSSAPHLSRVAYSTCDICTCYEARRWGDHMHPLLQVRKDPAPGLLQAASPEARVKTAPVPVKGCGVSLSRWHLLHCFIGREVPPRLMEPCFLTGAHRFHAEVTNLPPKVMSSIMESLSQGVDSL